LNSESVAKKIASLVLEKKAYDVIIMDIKSIASFADYFVICSADSDIQVKAIADHVTDEMKKVGERIWHSEGFDSMSWVLLDFVDVVVHVFLKQTRSYFNIEKIWGDAKIEYIDDELKEKIKKRTNRNKINAKIP